MVEVIMAKKAKRRGRPPGSKNKKKSPKGVSKNFARMEVDQLKSYITDLQGVLAAKIQQQRQFLEGQLAELQGYVSSKAGGVAGALATRTGNRRKPPAKYQSKKDK